MAVRWKWKIKLGKVKFDGYRYEIFGGENCMCAILLFQEKTKKETRYDFRDWADNKKMFEKYAKHLIEYNPPKEWTFKLTGIKVYDKDVADMVSVLVKLNQKVTVKPYKTKGK